ncbi:hypothetical protein ACFVDH_15445 [Streptomyces sp. NPDC057674]|uniref:hypothetical protein n=1 Tax=Streptomyces sp. NPDC057674 TaxID=3346203 RepID=UPI0036A990E4
MTQRLSEYRTLVMPDYGGFDLYDADFDVRDDGLIKPARARGAAGNGREICVVCAQTRFKVELVIETWAAQPDLLDGCDGYQEMQMEIPTGLLVISERTRGAWDISLPKGEYFSRISFFGRDTARQLADKELSTDPPIDHDGMERYILQMWRA